MIRFSPVAVVGRPGFFSCAFMRFRMTD